MRFMSRSLLAIVILGLTLGLLALAGGRVLTAVEERGAREDRRRPAQEREFTVNVATIAKETAKPVITAFGEISSRRTLELRAATSGSLVEISDSFRDGGFVSAGDLLFRIDPANAQSARDLADSEVKEAEAEFLEAEAALELAQAELDAAVDQKALREQAVARQLDLKERGVGSDAAVEAARLTLSGAVQTEISRKQALAQAKARILRAEIGQTRAAINLAEAERRLAETNVTAPFDGILNNVASVQGRLVGSNEQLGALIDLDALEVSFRVSGNQFARLIDERGRIRPVDVTAILDLAGAPKAASVTILRRQVDSLIVAAAPVGRDYVTKLQPQLGAGVKVKPVGEGVAPQAAQMMKITDEERTAFTKRVEENANIPKDAKTRIFEQLQKDEIPAEMYARMGGTREIEATPKAAEPQAATIELDADRRARLIAFVEGNSRMPADAKTRVLEQLKADAVPAAMVERIESRMGS